MDKEVLNAECRDISACIKDRLIERMESAVTTVNTGMILALGAFQKIATQSDSNAKDIVAKMAELIKSQEFRSSSFEQQTQRAGALIAALCGNIATQFHKHLENGEIGKAEKDIGFYMIVAQRLDEKEAIGVIRLLNSELEIAQEKKHSPAQIIKT
jgi:hypothetical protein